MTIKFYNSWFCPFAQTVWIGLLEKDIDFELIEIDPYAKTPEWLSINPRGLVPALVHEGNSIYESSVCLEYIQDFWPEISPSFLPSDPMGRARCRICSDHISKNVVIPFNRYLMKSDPKEQDLGRAQLLTGLEELVNAMHPEGPYFNGADQVCLVDIMLIPFALRIKPILGTYRGFVLPDVGDTWSRFDKWLKAISQRPAVRETIASEENLITFYKKYVSWQ